MGGGHTTRGAWGTGGAGLQRAGWDFGRQGRPRAAPAPATGIPRRLRTLAPTSGTHASTYQRHQAPGGGGRQQRLCPPPAASGACGRWHPPVAPTPAPTSGTRRQAAVAVSSGCARHRQPAAPADAGTHQRHPRQHLPAAPGIGGRGSDCRHRAAAPVPGWRWPSAAAAPASGRQMHPRMTPTSGARHRRPRQRLPAPSSGPKRQAAVAVYGAGARQWQADAPSNGAHQRRLSPAPPATARGILQQRWRLPHSEPGRRLRRRRCTSAGTRGSRRLHPLAAPGRWSQRHPAGGASAGQKHPWRCRQHPQAAPGSGSQ